MKFAPTLCLTILLAAGLGAQAYDQHLSVGGIGADTTYGVAVDTVGNSYAVFHYDGAVDVAVTGSAPLSGFLAGAVVKYNASKGVEWARQFTPVNAGDTVIPEMPAVDTGGNVYVTGRFKGSVDFDPGTGTEIRTAVDTGGAAVTGWNAFLVKLDAAGDLQWVRTFAGTDTWGMRVVCNATRVAMTGLYNGTMDLNPGAAAQNATTAATLYSAFVVMLNAGGELVWGDGNSSSLLDIATPPVFGTDNELIVAFGYAVAINVGQGGTAIAASGNTDMLIVRFSTLGGVLWTRKVGSAGANVVPTWMTPAPGGFMYISGQFRSTVDFDPGAGVATMTPQAGLDGFVARYSVAGDLVWAAQFNSANDVTVAACAADATGVVVSGSFNGTIDLDPSSSTQIHQSGNGHTFAVRLNGYGARVWSANFGAMVSLGGSESAVYGMASDGKGMIVIGGPYKGGADWDPGVGTISTTAVADRDAWLLWLTDAATAPPALVINPKTFPNLTEGAAASVTVTAAGGTPGYSWTLESGQLPPGITGLPATGTGVTLSGNPTTAGSYQFTLQVMDDKGDVATRSFTWLIQAPYTPPPVSNDGPRTASSGGCAASRDTGSWVLLGATLLALLGLAQCRRRHGHERVHLDA